MSAEHADYPHRPHRKGKPKASEHVSGKRRSWLERTAPPRIRERVEYKLDIHGCSFGHSNPQLRKFMQEHKNFFVPIRQWGGKSFVHV